MASRSEMRNLIALILVLLAAALLYPGILLIEWGSSLAAPVKPKHRKTIKPNY